MTGRAVASATARRRLGGALLLVAAGLSGLLALQHLSGPGLPGCTLDSPCQRALAGPYGTLPLGDWPVAFLGLTYFTGLLAAWLLAREGWPSSLRALTRAGVAGSVLFLALALVGRTLCPYCLAVQAANLAFLVVSEGMPRSALPARRAWLAFTFAAVLGSAGLALARARSERVQQRHLEDSLRSSAGEIERGHRARVFTGRYRRGPELAAIRLVLFTDYQCADCARVEGEAWQLCEERDDLSLSVKHFPLCKDCNRRARELGVDPHPNACWAARAAEAAGMLAGEDGFWRMHRWLFARSGSFTEVELGTGLAELDLDWEPFRNGMHSEETLARVLADVDEALELGIQSTPMVFVNGVELRGWGAPDALRRTVERVAASRPEVRGAEADRPPAALEKLLEDWRLEPELPGLQRAASAPAPHEVVLWGDYLDGATRDVDRLVREYARAHPGLGYSFRHYPLDPECVADAPSRHPGACRLALEAEAARLLGGGAAFERYHAWRMDSPGAELDAAARAAGLDVEAFRRGLGAEAARRSVEADVAAARASGIRTIPWLFVDGKRVARWQLEGRPVLQRLLDEALRH